MATFNKWEVKKEKKGKWKEGKQRMQSFPALICDNAGSEGKQRASLPEDVESPAPPLPDFINIFRHCCLALTLSVDNQCLCHSVVMTLEFLT